MADKAHGSDGLERVVFVSAGARHSSALVSYGGRIILRTTGSNAYGQLGHGYGATDCNRCGFGVSFAATLGVWYLSRCAA